MCDRFSAFFNDKILNVKAKVSVLKTKLTINSKQPAVHSINTTPLELFIETSEAEVSKLIARLANKSSPLDYIHTSHLKACSDVLTPLIVRLVNLSFAEGYFPRQFTRAQVTPLIKKEGLDVSDPANYRPISNLNTISKVMERLCLARLLPHIASNRIFQSVPVCVQEAS